MSKKVVLSSTAKEKLSDLLEYLERKWSKKIKNDFIKKLDRSMARISVYPQSCPESTQVKGLYKCVVTRQTSLFYRIKSEEIEVVTLFDTRQNSDKLN